MLLTGILNPASISFLPGDNFDLQSSHVLPALMCKFHEAKPAGSSEVVVWGTGAARGAGQDVSIRELAKLLREVVA